MPAPDRACRTRSARSDRTSWTRQPSGPITNAASCGKHGNNAGANIIVGGMNTSIVGTTNATGTTMITTGIDASAVGAAGGAIRPPSEPKRIADSDLTRNHQNGRSDSTKARARGRSKAACDLHINLQMEATTFMTPTGRILGYVCPVPSCRRRYNGISYFQEPEATVATNEGIPSDPCVSFGAF